MTLPKFTPMTHCDTAAPAGSRSVTPPARALIAVENLHRPAGTEPRRLDDARRFDTPTLAVFTRGQGRIAVAGETRGWGANHVAYIPRDVAHGIDVMGQASGYLLGLPAGPDFDWPAQSLHLRVLDRSDQAELMGLVEPIVREDAGDAAGRDRALHFLTGLLSVWLDRHAAAAETAEVSATSLAPR